MTGLASSSMVPLDIAIVAIGLSMVIGVLDVLRLPNWAWRKAEEPKIAYLALVALLPIVGLGMYLVRARPKVKAVTSAGRAASLPFERFGDGAPTVEEEQVAEAPEPIQLVAVAPMPASLTTVTPPAAPAEREPDEESNADEREPEPEREPVTVGGDTFFSSRGGGSGGTTTATRTVRLPASLTSLTSKPYHPRQRASLSEERITQAVPAGWKADPTGRHQFRYWNGAHWTENVADAGVQNRDAVCA